MASPALNLWRLRLYFIFIPFVKSFSGRLATTTSSTQLHLWYASTLLQQHSFCLKVTSSLVTFFPKTQDNLNVKREEKEKCFALSCVPYCLSILSFHVLQLTFNICQLPKAPPHCSPAFRLFFSKIM